MRIIRRQTEGKVETKIICAYMVQPLINKFNQSFLKQFKIALVNFRVRYLPQMR